VSRLEDHFGGRLPTAAELLAADPHVIRASGLSARKGETLRALAERFVDGRLSDKALSRMADDEVEAALTEVPGIGPWTAHGFLLVGSIGPTSSCPATSHCGGRLNGSTDSTIFRPKRRWSSSPSAGGRTGASR
jgi:DNA-3-methyladenine glycosylase II